MKTPTVDSHFDALEERIRALYAERDGAIQAGGRIASQLAKAWDHIRALADENATLRHDLERAMANHVADINAPETNSDGYRDEAVARILKAKDSPSDLNAPRDPDEFLKWLNNETNREVNP